MRNRTVTALFAAAALVLAVVPSHAGGDEIKVKGEILDLACYVGHEQHGADHAKCAVKCVKGGQPMGLLAEDGTVYVLFADHSDMNAYKEAQEQAGKTVEVAGTLTDRAGVKGLTVQGVKSL